MSNIEWDYVKPLKVGTEVDVVEVKYIFQLPADLKECLKENNGGSPYPCSFDFGKNIGKVFGGLLSFNDGDNVTFYEVLDRFTTSEGNRLKMFPFGYDPAGNFLCVEDGNIVFYDTEMGETFFICKNFTEFLAMLYE